jgi:hypothetical protein
VELIVRKSEFAKFWEISKGRVSQLIRLGILKQDENGRLPARENIERLVLYRHRPRKKPVKVSLVGELEIDLGDAFKKFSEGGMK